MILMIEILCPLSPQCCIEGEKNLEDTVRFACPLHVGSLSRAVPVLPWPAEVASHPLNAQQRPYVTMQTPGLGTVTDTHLLPSLWEDETQTRQHVHPQQGP